MTTLTTDTIMGDVVRILQNIRNTKAINGSIRIYDGQVVHRVHSGEWPQDPKKVLDLIMLLLGFVYTNESGSIRDFEISYNLEVEEPQEPQEEASAEADTTN